MATGSRPKALEVFGAKQDLFATGLANELSGGPTMTQPWAAPGEVIERGLAIDVGKITKAHKPKKLKGPTATASQCAKAEELATRLKTLDTDHAGATAALYAAAAENQQRRDALERDYERARRTAAAELKTTRAKL